jgi:hypothetical protein
MRATRENNRKEERNAKDEGKERKGEERRGSCYPVSGKGGS